MSRPTRVRGLDTRVTKTLDHNKYPQGGGRRKRQRSRDVYATGFLQRPLSRSVRARGGRVTGDRLQKEKASIGLSTLPLREAAA